MFSQGFTLIGAVHLPPLPGSPRSDIPFEGVAARALEDARTLLQAGFDGLIVENFGDAPFFPESVEPHTVAMMTVIVGRIRTMMSGITGRKQSGYLGVNVLRNDAFAALGIATATNADFVRVNVHTGAMVTDQGVLHGLAHRSMRYRKAIGSSVEVFADVLVKHASTLGKQVLEETARDTLERGLADALIVSGAGTGAPTSPDELDRVRRAVPFAPILAGSGVSTENIDEMISVCHGAIVGTSLKRDGLVENPVDFDRAVALVHARDHLLQGLSVPSIAHRDIRRVDQ